MEGILEICDNYYMKKALIYAKKAYKKGEVPVGAVVVYNDKIIGYGYNLRESKNDPTSHAEIIAIKRASKLLNSWRLSECTLYVTLEPCAMCSGAIINSRIKRLVFGAYDKKAGCCGSYIDIFENKFNHVVDIEGGVLEEDCVNILKDFFKDLRDK